jgi:hypothetical protein
MAALWLANPEEAEQHQGRNSKNPQTQLCKPGGKIRRHEGDPNGTGLKQNLGRGAGWHQILAAGHLRGSSHVGWSGGGATGHVMSLSYRAGQCSSTSSQGSR